MDIRKIPKNLVSPAIVINYPNHNEYNRLEMLAVYKKQSNNPDTGLQIYCPTLNDISPSYTEEYIPSIVKFFINKGVLNPSSISIIATEEMNHSIENTIKKLKSELEQGFKEYKSLALRANDLDKILPKGISLEDFLK